MSSSKSNATRVITPVAILSYPWLDEAQAPLEGSTGKPMFSAALIFVPEIMQRFAKFGPSLDGLKAAAGVAAAEKFGDKLTGLLRNPNFKTGFREDGDEKGYPKGAIYINARSERRPGLVYLFPEIGCVPAEGKSCPPALVPEDRIKEDFYPGALVRASVRAFGFDRAGNRGVSFALNHIQLIDGTAPRLDSRKAAQDDFEADPSKAPASLDDLGVE